jgi:hypothetical protein
LPPKEPLKTLSIVKFELDFFEEFLQRELIEKRTIEPVVADFEAKKELIALAVERVKVNLRNQLFSQLSESHFERYIQQHQTCIIGLADEVLSLLDEEEVTGIASICPKHSWCNLAKILYKSLDELLTYIEKYFSKFFNQQAKIPDCYAILSAKEIEEKLNAILTVCKNNNVNVELLKIVTTPLKKFTSDPIKAGLNFRQLIYYKALVTELTKCTEEIDELTASIINQLLYLNFNATKFLNYYTRRIIRQMEEDTSLASQLEQLVYHRKLINQLQLKPGFAFKTNYALDIQKQITNWITEEINYIEESRKYKLIILPAKEEEEQPKFKISTSLSVPQLTLLFKLLVENNLIKVRNVSHLVKFLANNFTSLRNETISVNSLRNKYYDQDEATSRSLAEILNKLMMKNKKPKS